MYLKATQEKKINNPEMGTEIQSSYLDTGSSSLCICQFFVFLTAVGFTAMFHSDVPLIFVFFCTPKHLCSFFWASAEVLFIFLKMSSHIHCVLCIKMSEFLAYHVLWSCLWKNACEKIAFY